jgi:hypothetical protein
VTFRRAFGTAPFDIMACCACGTNLPLTAAARPAIVAAAFGGTTDMTAPSERGSF